MSKVVVSCGISVPFGGGGGVTVGLLCSDVLFSNLYAGSDHEV